MTILKLQRIGKKHQAHFRLVVGEKRSKLAGKQIEYLGTYNPRTHAFTPKTERIQHWLANGAQKTPTVHNLLITHGVIEGKKIAVHKMAKKEAAAAAPAA